MRATLQRHMYNRFRSKSVLYDSLKAKVLNMNGVSTAYWNASPEIRDGRVLPLRDLGYALGLSESQISWDATTQTVRLN